MESSSDAECPFYEVTQGESLAQGDVLIDFPLVVLHEPYEQIRSDTGPKTTVDEFDTIIVSQSCDLEHGKLESVLICPFFAVGEIVEVIKDADSGRARESARKKLGQGIYPALYPIPPCTLPEFEKPCHIVSFRQVAAVPLGLVQAEARPDRRRLRLRSPYREHLGQAFGHFIMRVGLPVPFEVK